MLCGQPPAGRTPPVSRDGYALVTGGAGFLGAALSERLLNAGRTVRVLDDLTGAESARRAQALKDRHGARVEVDRGDVRDAAAVAEAVAGASVVFHLAHPPASRGTLHDFEVVARGLLHVIRALKRREAPPPLIHVSSRRVYGALEGLALTERPTRYEPTDPELRTHGLSEELSLDLRGAWGISQGLADGYVLQEARAYKLPCLVLRLGAVYGPGQPEGRGWLRRLAHCSRGREPFLVQGDGKQVHDLLHLSDCVEALCQAEAKAELLAGHAYNLGGGPTRALSVLEALQLLEELAGEKPPLVAQPRPACEARYYASDTRRFQRATGWEAVVSVREGLEELLRPSVAGR